MSEIYEVDSLDQLQDLIDTEDKLVVKFTAPSWCGPCRQYAPHFEKVAEKSADTFVVVDLDEVPDAMLEYGFKSVPTTLVFESGELTKTIIGVRTAPKLLAELDA